MHKLRHDRQARPVFRVTAARPGVAADVRARQRRYVIAMSIRSVCFVLAVIVPGWFRLAFVIAAVVLPYFSVVFANAGREPAEPMPTTFIDVRERRELPAATPPADAGDPSPDGAAGTGARR